MRKLVLVGSWVWLLGMNTCYAASEADLAKLMALKNTPQAVHLDFSNTDLRRYPFVAGKIDLQAANFSHSNLSGVDLSRMNLGGADFREADLSNAKLNQANLMNANFEHANLTGAEIQQSDLSGANFNHAILSNAKLQQSIFVGANLVCARLDGANLSRANFSRVDISGASFVNTMTVEMVGYGEVVERRVDCG